MIGRWVEAAGLIVLAVVAAGPVSTRLARARRTAREPVAALVAWQGIGLCGGLAVLTAELTVGAADRRGSWRPAVGSVIRSPASVGPVEAVGLVLFALSLAWLTAVLVTSFVGAARSRREHRLLLELLCRPDPVDGGFELIESSAPVAYSVPGRTSHVVLSTAARTTLSERELAAVLAHERAHLRQRHSLLVQPFVAWQRSLPGLSAPSAARRRVEELVEMLCDDAAARSTGPRYVSAALDRMLPPGPAHDERVERLAEAPAPQLRAALLAAAAGLVIVPPLLLVLFGR